ncbi:hypothetical protein [Sinomicrobium sp. M5D2P9]
MISVNQARQFIQDHSPTPVIVESAIDTTLGKILAVAVDAPFDFPHFRQSAMDGYAIRQGRKNYVVKAMESLMLYKTSRVGSGFYLFCASLRNNLFSLCCCTETHKSFAEVHKESNGNKKIPVAVNERL